MKPNHIKGFDGLRAFSILVVLLSHLGFYSLFPESNIVVRKISLLFTGVTGVNVFFALSGFLITRLLLIEKREKGRISIGKFFLRRFLRLLPPLLIFYSGVAVCMHYHLIVTTKIGLLFSFFYLYNFVPSLYYTRELGHTWSLAVEEQFYLFWPWIIAFVNNSKVIAGISLIIIISCLFFIGMLRQHLVGFENAIPFLTNTFNSYRWFIPAVAPIMIGALFSLLVYYNFSPTLQYWMGIKHFPFFSLILFCSTIIFNESIFEYTYIIQSLGACFFLVWIFYNQESIVTTFLELKPIAYLGKISYGVYVYQGFFIGNGEGGLTIQRFPFNIILTIISAVLSYHFVEKKILKLKRY